jgi:excisionase family DNA binding protein
MPEIYTIREVAEILKINPETCKVYARSGKLKTFKVGNRIRVKQPDLMDFISRAENKKQTAKGA